jgi:AraC-like DNA-binding protein
MAGALIPSGILGDARALITKLGGRADDIAQQGGLPLAALAHADLLVPARTVIDFLERAAQDCGCPTFGLRLGQMGRLAAVVGPLWILLRHARTVGQMCEDFARNFDLYTNAAMLRFEPQADGALLTWSVAAGQAEREVQTDEFALAICCTEIRHRCGPGWQPRGVQFRHAAPPDLSLHRRLFGQQLLFNQDRNGLLLDAATLGQALEGGSHHARELARSLLRLDDDCTAPALAARVESVVRALLPFGPCMLKDVSLALGVSERTLQEHLQAQGQGFKDIKDAVRADLALKYLKHSTLSLAEIAEILGYSELSAFSRSFRRWHGQAARSIRAKG